MRRKRRQAHRGVRKCLGTLNRQYLSEGPGTVKAEPEAAVPEGTTPTHVPGDCNEMRAAETQVRREA